MSSSNRTAYHKALRRRFIAICAWSLAATVGAYFGATWPLVLLVGVLVGLAHPMPKQCHDCEGPAAELTKISVTLNGSAYERSLCTSCFTAAVVRSLAAGATPKQGEPDR